MKAFVCVLLLAGLLGGRAMAADPIKVAFVLSDHANVMDIAGPWEVFQDTTLDDEKETAPFKLYTVAPTTAPLLTTGSGGPGMTITPDYSFDDAPAPDIVVVGAQAGGPGLDEWLRRQHDAGKTIVSICTGAFKLAQAGLLDGSRATTHHWYFGDFVEQFPNVKLVREVRYVQSAPTIFTAGGLTSGVDLSLHIVARYFGQKQAQRTADYLEYQGTGWKSNKGIAALTAPVKRQQWAGKIGGRTDIVLHRVTTGASNAFTTDIPSRHVFGARTTIKSEGRRVSFTVPLDGQLASFAGDVSAGDTQLSGTFTAGQESLPLTLTLAP